MITVRIFHSKTHYNFVFKKTFYIKFPNSKNSLKTQPQICQFNQLAQILSPKKPQKVNFHTHDHL